MAAPRTLYAPRWPSDSASLLDRAWRTEPQETQLYIDFMFYDLIMNSNLKIQNMKIIIRAVGR